MLFIPGKRIHPKRTVWHDKPNSVPEAKNQRKWCQVEDGRNHASHMTKSWRLTVIMGDRGLYMQTKKGCLSKICRLGSQAVLLWDPPNPRGEPFLAQPLTNCQGSPFPHHDTEKMLAVGRSRSLALQGQR